MTFEHGFNRDEACVFEERGNLVIQNDEGYRIEIDGGDVDSLVLAILDTDFCSGLEDLFYRQ